MPVIVKDRVWESINYEPHPDQKEIHDSLIRNRLVAGGRRFGKSQIGGHEFVPEAVKTYSMLQELEDKGKQRIFWIGGPDYSDTEKEFRVVYNDLKKLEMPFDKPGTYNAPWAGDMRISLWDGRFLIETKSAKYPDSFDGEGLAGAMLVEAAKLHEYIFEKYIRPALSDERGWSFLSSTPEGKNWFYKYWRRGQDPTYTEWASWRKPSWKNIITYPGGRRDPEILSMEHDMSKERFGQQIAADFTDFVGRVFKDFDEEIHVKDVKYDPDLPLIGACDYGWQNPFVWLAIQYDVWANVYVIGEYREVHKDIEDVARDLVNWPLASDARRFFPDPSEPGDTNVLMRHLRIPAMPNTGGELKWRLEAIRKGLKLQPEDAPYERRQPKLYIDRKCKGLIRDMLDYRYAESKEESVRANPEEPLDKDNDGPEALGRFYIGHFGSPALPGRGNAKIRKAVIHS